MACQTNSNVLPNSSFALWHSLGAPLLPWISAEALLPEQANVFLGSCVSMLAQVMQILPGVDATLMQVIKQYPASGSKKRFCFMEELIHGNVLIPERNMHIMQPKNTQPCCTLCYLSTNDRLLVNDLDCRVHSARCQFV